MTDEQETKASARRRQEREWAQEWHNLRTELRAWRRALGRLLRVVYELSVVLIAGYLAYRLLTGRT